MPIRSREDAVEVQDRIQRIFDAPGSERGAAVRSLFVEVLDFDAASGHVDLGAAPGSVALPASAERVAYSGGVQVVYLALEEPESDRVGKGEAATAARLINQQLDGDLLLVVTNSSASQLHLVYPSFDNVRPVLRRMVVERDLARRTAVQQVSNIYWKHRDTGSIQIALDEAFDVEPVTREFFRSTGGSSIWWIKASLASAKTLSLSDGLSRRSSTGSCSSISCPVKDGSPSRATENTSTPC